jgi:hypothetical protein
MMHSELALHDTLVAAILFYQMLLLNLYHILKMLYSKKIALMPDVHVLSPVHDQCGK